MRLQLMVSAGRKSADAIALELAKRGWVPTVVASSDSARTRETWKRMRKAFSKLSTTTATTNAPSLAYRHCSRCDSEQRPASATASTGNNAAREAGREMDAGITTRTSCQCECTFLPPPAKDRVHFLPGLYHGHAGTGLEGVRQVLGALDHGTFLEADTVLLLGHNPGWEAMASSLTGSRFTMPTACCVLMHAEVVSVESVFNNSSSSSSSSSNVARQRQRIATADHAREVCIPWHERTWGVEDVLLPRVLMGGTVR